MNELKYKFGVVNGDFYCTSNSLLTLENTPNKVTGDFVCSYCQNLTSLKGCPEIIGGNFDFRSCKNIISFKKFPKEIKGDIVLIYNKFSNAKKSDFKFHNKYIDMWFELLDSVSDDEKIEYINNYKNKHDYFYKEPIIPKEVINQYKIVFLLNEK